MKRSFSKLAHYLKRPYRREYHPVYSTLIITLLVLFIIAILKPFNIAKVSARGYVLLLVSTAVGVVSGMLIVHYLIPFHFKRFYARERWTVGKDILHTAFAVFVVGITNGIAHGICQVLYRDASSHDFWNILVELFVYTLILSPVPVFVLAIINHNRTLTFSLQQMQEINASWEKKDEGSHAAPDETQIELTGATKEKITVSANNLLYIEACGNYVKVNYLEEERVCQKMLRATIKQMEDMLKDYSFIVRCHRTFLVNTRHVAEVKGNSQGYRFILRQTKTEISISRAYARLLKEQIG